MSTRDEILIFLSDGPVTAGAVTGLANPIAGAMGKISLVRPRTFL